MSTLSRLRKPIVLLAAATGVVALGVSVARVPGAADGAREELTAARTAIESGEEEAADAAVARARDHVDTVQVGVQGPLGLLGQWLPVVGTSVRDVRHLGNALDAVTTVAELGAETYPEITGADSTFFTNGEVDIPTLRRLVANTTEAHQELADARSSLEDIEATGPGAARLDTARDEALAQVIPIHDSLTATMPLVEQLPTILGAEGERKYLVAILNPAELRYSGGAPLTLTPITVLDGRVEFGEATDTESNTFAFQPRYWRKVKGNSFHNGRMRLVNATIPPSWPVAGEETLNAWRSLRGRNMAGLFVVDVIALARLAELTGPMEVPGYGRVDADNMVETLVGSYDRFTEVSERKAANRALVPLFMERLLQTGGLPDKVKILTEAARGRHFAAYFREDGFQETLGEMAVTGDLSETENDYLGVFTQNVGSSKTDYWQSRQVRSDVRLRPDGSARVALEVEIHNDTPPYAGAGPHYRQGYSTRYATLSVGNFLPRGSDVDAVSVDGAPIDFVVGNYFGRPFVRHTIAFDPQQRHTMRLEYDVPAAAVRDGKELTYSLDLDPQGMVRAQSVSATVHFPAGFEIDSLPEGWSASGPGSATWSVDALDESPRLALTAR
ncbi:DUF4012 domain-containing protein [Nocardioides sp.]|uniref:DUF4012 domain-containing protein n=1 Tax=Nocardioides sp. TaxID=35761 RepID=UPI002C7852F6|nr:DUF4012 domain-containing protein [Nocardioides sp.]HXH77238.1 DUF4012 domain-containing protein [Nocardioides sp.]